jgi:PTS system nitrogen regulatory IIA component
MELTFKDVVNIFAVSEETVNSWIEKSRLPCIKANEQYRFNYIELLDWAIENKIRLTPEILDMKDQTSQNSEILNQALNAGNIYYDISGNTREEVLKSIVEILPLSQKLNKKSLWQMLIAREKMMSTAIGNGIAIPHVRNPVVLQMEHPCVTLCFSKNPVDFKALDGKLISILFILLSPSVKKHLAILSRLAFCLQNELLQKALQERAPREQILAEIKVLELKIISTLNKDKNKKSEI